MGKLRVFLSVYFARRGLIKALVIRDFRSRYVGSALGLTWAILQPIAMMTTLYLVFAYGLKSQARHGASFISWFFSAVVAWNFLQEVLLSSTNVYREYSYLIKKMDFPLAILPLVKILSSLIVHLVFMAIILLIVTLNNGFPGWYLFQVFYYLFAMIYLLFGLTWFLSTFHVLLKDVGQIVAILVQFGFWATPIVWPIDALPSQWHFLVKLNPAYYIIEGYRNSFVHKVPIWREDFLTTVYFWVVSSLIFIIGLLAFKKLKPHFADVL